MCQKYLTPKRLQFNKIYDISTTTIKYNLVKLNKPNY